MGQQQAVSKGESYLDLAGFSRQGLIDQLVYEGFSEADATFAVDRIAPDWRQEAVEKAQSYLDMAGFSKVRIIASGGLSPERIRELDQAGADSFGVGSYISHADPIDMTMDIKEIDGEPVAKRGRLPGRMDNPRLTRVV